MWCRSCPNGWVGAGRIAPTSRRCSRIRRRIKLFHFARFDVAILKAALGVTVAPVRCTKIASKLVRTYTDRHGLKDLCRDLLGIELSKQQQTSDWGAVELTPEQRWPTPPPTCCICTPCGNGWRGLLRREGAALAEACCYAFPPARGELDLLGFEDPDIFAHHA